jgi:hypothetical protein
VSYNASAVKIYNATSSFVCFENKNIFFYFSSQAYYNAGIVVVNSGIVELAPGINVFTPSFTPRGEHSEPKV